MDLVRAHRELPARVHKLLRRPRTPSSISYRPPPLRYPLGTVRLPLPQLGPCEVEAEATVFDFGAVSLGLRVPFRLSPSQMTHLAAALADPSALVQAAHTLLEPLYQKLRPAIQKPDWPEHLSEEYLVFELPPGPALQPGVLLEQHGPWLAGLLRLEAGPLSDEQVADALRLKVRYAPDDLFLPDWGAAVLIDHDCDETLQVIEFANVQLLEYRFLDNRLDDILGRAYRLIQPLARRALPLARSYGRPLRQLGELKVDANEIFERTGNVLKLVGDQYLARAYRQLAVRFHLEQWEQSIQRKLETVEGVYKVLSDQAETARAEVMELIIILLIAFEIVMAFVRH